ncbi:FAD:protein FMN transferase [uncultured Muriicola sp.]|uniref:FAD:protein FMN transferase n=1 Tax=uncultured Muriicola sp. TaxID=1583102 RepID=UPI002614C2C9|nr:FAD:protein FMN transferase [uncultured Muriicola sp.]
MKALLRSKRTILFVSLLSILLVSCQQQKPWIKNTNTGDALGTSYSIIYLANDSLDLKHGIDSVFQVVNASMSTYIPSSDISRINKGDSSVVVDAMFREVMAISREVYIETNGYFDPTVGILVNAWGFGPGVQTSMDSATVETLRSFVGLDKIKVTEDFRIEKESPEIQIDFNAIAKGYAIDRLAAFLDNKELQNYLVEVGGEIVAKGENKIKSQEWVVGIDDPQVTLGRQLKITLNLKDEALASSGNYRKFRIDSLTGQKYVHTIDPKTGFTKNSNVLAASVIAPSCAVADAYATAFMAMDLEASIALLNSNEILEGYLIYLDTEGKVTEFMTPGFNEKVRR